MRYLGIDYGEKRVGLALSDEEGRIAFPREILSNDSKIFENIKKIMIEENISGAVVGETALIKEKVIYFKNKLEEVLGFAVHTEKEELTTLEARRYESGPADARAAAIILQRYLDRKN